MVFLLNTTLFTQHYAGGISSVYFVWKEESSLKVTSATKR